MAKLKLTSPWYAYYNKLVAFFGDDPEVNVIFDEDAMEIKVLVDSNYMEKAETLSNLLNPTKEFGDTTLKIIVVPANGKTEKYITESVNRQINDRKYQLLYQCILISNPIFYKAETIKGLFGWDAVYVIFKKDVIQYYIDNIGDFYGVESTLAENIARDIFVQVPGVFFCTDIE